MWAPSPKSHGVRDNFYDVRGRAENHLAACASHAQNEPDPAISRFVAHFGRFTAGTKSDLGQIHLKALRFRRRRRSSLAEVV
jgi:hypothetical protein